MNGDESAQMIYGLMVIMLLIGGLAARRVPMNHVLRHLAIWGGVFACLFVLFSFKDGFRAGWDNVKSQLSPGGETSPGGIVRLRQGADGHFSADVDINGRSVRMLVDSGATTTAISSDTARRVGIEVDRSAFPIIVSTANGMAESWRATAERLVLSGIVRKDFPVHVSDTLGDTDLLGMNFLSTLKSWRVEGDTMILEP